MFQSQACQDQFVEAVLKGKRNGFWLELGGNDAKQISNTYYLEKALNWSGITVEFDWKHAESYRQHARHQTHLAIADATIVDYPKVFTRAKAPTSGIIDYLQIDLEPKNGSTWNALQLIERDLMPSYRFSVVTFEHDCYCTPSEKLREPARELFKRNGYELLFPDVVCAKNDVHYVFEDWYVHPADVSLKVDMSSIPKVTRNLCPKTLQYGLLPEDCVAYIKRCLN